MNLGELAVLLGGEVAGDATPEIRTVAPLERGAPGTIVYAADAAALAVAEAGETSAVLLPADLTPGHKPAIRAANARLAFARLLAHFAPSPERVPGVHPSALLASGVALGPDVHVGAYVVLGPRVRVGARTALLAECVVEADVEIGADCLIYPHVTIRERTIVGDRVILHPGVVLGSDGFGYAQSEEGPVKIPHLGRVVIEDDVEIGANATVDRGTLGETRVGRRTKIDNLVQVGHNVQIGQAALITAQSGIAGSATLGDGVIMAGQSGVSDHVAVGAGAVVGAKAGVFKDVPAGQIVSGMPARPLREERRAQALVRRLPELFETVRRLQRRLEELLTRPSPPSGTAPR